MKNSNIKKAQNTLLLAVLVSVSLIECKCKKAEIEKINTTVTNTTLADFFSKNGVQSQKYKINATTGGTFTSPQGTVVTIPANAFVALGGSTPITGDVEIEFKDIYKKSDMLLSNMPTQTADGPLVSGGEFFINAVAIVADMRMNVAIAEYKNISVQQPAIVRPIDYSMTPFVFNTNTAVWQPATSPNTTGTAYIPSDSIQFYDAKNYFYNVYSLAPWTWHNCDHSFEKNSTTLTIHSNNINTLNFDNSSSSIYLIFDDINSMVNIHGSGENANYKFSPIGFDCTLVILSTKDGKIYSSFTHTTITENKTINVDVTETTTEAFKTALKALD
jgi:hypothetical protein